MRGKSALFRLVVRNGFAHFVWKVFARRKLLSGKFWVFAPLGGSLLKFKLLPPKQQHLSGLGFRPEKVNLSLSQLYKKDKWSLDVSLKPHLDVTLKPHLMLIEARTSPETPALGTANTEGSAA